ncbi:hypothetical protein JX265_010934 [Neoarthrinium moseri]|uniref:Protein HRI1 n=1 Tax=Neoarthrinium moseri TaxID=1658444 RepID=A0A9P9WD47_9PEZI|nr:uncharacterized protein JN550_007298 [Neoarthrinium moseri]KAI1851700.1 hypothetical protein JX266_003162 [Neoarthrinium moseri]KAI1857904.1 hypothetical protein JX265_010934 [Neoarthrinium moseri]KAI1867246.1 hypothetical protein JN550_007298 [Neoarthrinium moseri]
MPIKDTPQTLKRVSIRWLPEPAYEDSDTIALNVGGYFMDLRVGTADGSLQWSRCGERKKLKEDPLTCQWTRIIDSLGSTDPDEAAFSELPNGDSLEYGTFNKDGVPTSYEEVWRDVKATVDSENWAWIIQSVDGSTFLGKLDNIFLGMKQQVKGGSFAVRKEEYDGASKEWKTTFADGDTDTIPRALDALKIEGGERVTGQTVVVNQGDYVIRGIARS